MISSRRGQFYIFASVLFVSMVFFMLANTISLESKEDNFRDAYENYVFEAKQVINNAVHNGQNVSDQFNNFTLDYIRYARIRNIDVGILYVLAQDGQVRIVNYLNSPVYYDDMSHGISFINHDSSRVFNMTGDFSIELGDSKYSYSLDGAQGVQFKALFQKKGH
jgi:hypothetical protein